MDLTTIAGEFIRRARLVKGKLTVTIKRLMLLAVMLLPLACSRKDDSKEQQLIRFDRATLLSIDDMPSGWSVLVESAADMEEEDDDDAFLCKKDFPSMTEDEGAEGDGVALIGGVIGPMVLHVFVAHASEDRAKDSFAVLVAMGNECKTWTDEKGKEHRVSPLSFGRYGDESAAFRELKDMTQFDYIFIRKRNAIVFLGFVESPLAPLADDLPEQLTRRAMAKLSD